MNDREVMQRIMQVLGPEPVCECRGCNWETGEALRLLREAGITYQGRKAPPGMPHNPVAERRGNAVEDVIVDDGTPWTSRSTPSQFLVPVLVVSPIHQGEEGTGPLVSTDILYEGRGVMLLINVLAGDSCTYAFSVDGRMMESGTIPRGR